MRTINGFGGGRSYSNRMFLLTFFLAASFLVGAVMTLASAPTVAAVPV